MRNLANKQTNRRTKVIAISRFSRDNNTIIICYIKCINTRRRLKQGSFKSGEAPAASHPKTKPTCRLIEKPHWVPHYFSSSCKLSTELGDRMKNENAASKSKPSGKDPLQVYNEIRVIYLKDN